MNIGFDVFDVISNQIAPLFDEVDGSRILFFDAAIINEAFHGCLELLIEIHLLSQPARLQRWIRVLYELFAFLLKLHLLNIQLHELAQWLNEEFDYCLYERHFLFNIEFELLDKDLRLLLFKLLDLFHGNAYEL